MAKSIQIETTKILIELRQHLNQNSMLSEVPQFPISLIIVTVSVKVRSFHYYCEMKLNYPN